MESIGIGVTTRNRPDTLSTALRAHRTYLPPNARLVVVDDASTPPVDWADFRFSENAGIARAKNKCLALLEGCEHVFLFDDDAWPYQEGWWKPYTASSEPHLSCCYVGTRTSKGGSRIVDGDEDHVAFANGQGIMLYAHRSALDAVGGMDERFGLYGHEHQDWSNRIHAAGLTRWRYADVRGSENLIYSLDRLGKARPNLTRSQVRAQHKLNLPLRTEQADKPVYHPYS